MVFFEDYHQGESRQEQDLKIVWEEETGMFTKAFKYQKLSPVFKKSYIAMDSD